MKAWMYNAIGAVLIVVMFFVTSIFDLPSIAQIGVGFVLAFGAILLFWRAIEINVTLTVDGDSDDEDEEDEEDEDSGITIRWSSDAQRWYADIPGLSRVYAFTLAGMAANIETAVREDGLSIDPNIPMVVVIEPGDPHS